MIEDTVLIQFIVRPITPSSILSAEDGEKAYALKIINHGETFYEYQSE